MYCKHCGSEIDDDATFCSHCGEKVHINVPVQSADGDFSLCCPVCGSTNVDTQVYQENKASKTKSRTKSKYRQKGHGCLWWLFIGSWWWIVDLALWICIFPIRFLIQLFKKRKYVGESTTDTTTKNKVSYKTVYLCKSCGHHW